MTSSGISTDLRVATIEKRSGSRIWFYSQWMPKDIKKVLVFAVPGIFFSLERLHILIWNLVCRFIIQMYRSNYVLDIIEQFLTIMSLGVRSSFHSPYLCKGLKYGLLIYLENVGFFSKMWCDRSLQSISEDLLAYTRHTW